MEHVRLANMFPQQRIELRARQPARGLGTEVTFRRKQRDAGKRVPEGQFLAVGEGLRSVASRREESLQR